MKTGLLLLALACLSSCDFDGSPRTWSRPGDARAASVHEAGHVVFALAHPRDFIIESASIHKSDRMAGAGLTNASLVSDGSDVERTARLEIAMALAGRAAENSVLGGSGVVGSSDDISKAESLSVEFAGSADGARRIFLSADRLADTVVRRHGIALSRISSALYRKATISGAEAASLF